MIDEFARNVESAAARLTRKQLQSPPPDAFHVVSTGHAAPPARRWWQLGGLDYSLVGLWCGVGALVCVVGGVLCAALSFATKLLCLGGVFACCAALLLVVTWRYG